MLSMGLKECLANGPDMEEGGSRDLGLPIADAIGADLALDLGALIIKRRLE
jgi:hypothetical protein